LHLPGIACFFKTGYFEQHAHIIIFGRGIKRVTWFAARKCADQAPADAPPPEIFIRYRKDLVRSGTSWQI
jgi:hypothetical protein